MPNLYMRELLLEVVENQIKGGDPPETKSTLERLVSQGIERKEAKRLIACVIAGEMFDILKSQEPFNRQRFVDALDRLPVLDE